LQAAQAASSSDAVFSTSKVNEIKQAISEGRFSVNSEKVADGLLDSVHDLLGSRQRN
jgi:negative regulator of flagellin synthesis FlgM